MSKARCHLDSHVIHITQRGIGKRIIFEDDSDKRRFLKTLSEKLAQTKIKVYAWCLMDNHFHLLVQGDQPEISKLMQRLCISYAQYFNGRHGHVGKVFQNRFASQPVRTEAHLIAAIRYIHLNCRDSGTADPAAYAWSSYRECIGQSDAQIQDICDSTTTVALFGNLEEFERFHADSSFEDGFAELVHRRRLSDEEASSIARRQLGAHYSDRLSSLPKVERDSKIRILKELGLSTRQITRLTGIGRGIVDRA